MKTRLCFVILLLFGSALRAQTGAPEAELTQRTPEQLDTLLAPIALYPDALVALILPASTNPSDIVLASRYLSSGGDVALAKDQPWDESVRYLVHYRDLLLWLDENLSWTKQLGLAFLAQPADVMKAVQRLRARARAAGSLVDTPQQVVVMDGDIICIVPASPELIYIPRYDYQVVYRPRTSYSDGWYVSFGIGFGVGYWLAYDCDWYGHSIWIDERRHERGRDHDWRRPVFPRGLPPTVPHSWRSWEPPAWVAQRHRNDEPYKGRSDSFRPTLYREKAHQPEAPPPVLSGNPPARREGRQEEHPQNQPAARDAGVVGRTQQPVSAPPPVRPSLGTKPQAREDADQGNTSRTNRRSPERTDPAPSTPPPQRRGPDGDSDARVRSSAPSTPAPTYNRNSSGEAPRSAPRSDYGSGSSGSSNRSETRVAPPPPPPPPPARSAPVSTPPSSDRSPREDDRDNKKERMN